MKKRAEVPAGSHHPLFAEEGSYCQEGWAPLSTGATLRYYHFHTNNQNPLPVIVFVPGLVSVMDNFKGVLKGIRQQFEIFYVETREKKSARLNPGMNFSVNDLACDLSDFLDEYINPSHPYILMGYSLGAAVILETMGGLSRKPYALVLVEPSAEFNFPLFLRLLAHFVAPFYPLIKPLVLLYSRLFRINTKEDAELFQIMKRALNSASPKRLCQTLLAISSYKVWEKLPYIKGKILIIGASRDKLHTYSETLMLNERLSGSQLVDLETNLRNHSEEVAEVMIHFLN